MRALIGFLAGAWYVMAMSLHSTDTELLLGTLTISAIFMMLYIISILSLTGDKQI